MYFDKDIIVLKDSTIIVYANAATRTTSNTIAREASSAAKDLNVAARGSGSYDNVRIPQDSSLPHEQGKI